MSHKSYPLGIEMIYVFLVLEVLVTIFFLFAFFVGSAFQGESLRHTQNNPVSTTLHILVFLLTLVPAAISTWSAFRLWGQHDLPIRIGWQILICLSCAFLGYGLMIVNEMVAPSAYRYTQERKIRSLIDSAKNGNGVDACKLVQMETIKSDEVFPVCKTYIEALTPDQRWKELEKLTIGAKFRTRTLTSKEGTSVEQSVIPTAFQEWFLKEYFSAYIASSPKDGVTLEQASEDLLIGGNLLRSLTIPGAWDSDALGVFREELLPKIEEHYVSRLTVADEASKDLRIIEYGLADKSAPGYTFEAENAKGRAAWFREGLSEIKASVK